MTTGKQPAPQKGNAAQLKPADIEAVIPAARIEALMNMGRAFPPVVTALSLSLLASISASGWLVYRDLHRTPIYFTTDAAGRAVEVTPLNEPSMTREQVSQYALNALVSSMSMDYANYKDRQLEASVSFTPEAFDALVKNFTDQGIFSVMLDRKLVLRAVATGAPVVAAEGTPAPGKPYAWVVQIPVAWTFNGARTDKTVKYVAQAVVTRQSTLERPNGIAITAITLANAPGGEGL